MNLPGRFKETMQQLLGTEYDAYLKSCGQACCQGLRINTLKLDQHMWEDTLNPFSLRPVPWTANGYYYEADEQPAKDVYYHAGLYYLQEPSAMAPAAQLPVKPGDMVLDLCAAPGGKSTELGARLKGAGLLVANDISNSRAKALLKNLELSGIANVCVTSATPEKLAAHFTCFFDSILVDAPCSGEGMFRKDPGLIRSYKERGPEYYAPLQREILTQAVKMLKPGGHLLYSTCTFSVLEDEDTLEWLLAHDAELELVPLPLFDGAAPGVGGEPVLRLFPHRIEGEGHFIALLQKKAAAAALTFENNHSSLIPERKDWQKLKKETDFFEFLELVGRNFDKQRLMIKQELIYYLPEQFSERWKLRYLRTGLLLGELKNKRFQPSQAFAMNLGSEEFSGSLSFAHGDERVIRYLKGETVSLYAGEADVKGWCLICVDGFALGWGKGTGRSLKNKYYPGWRRQGGS